MLFDGIIVCFIHIMYEYMYRAHIIIIIIYDCKVYMNNDEPTSHSAGSHLFHQFNHLLFAWNCLHFAYMTNANTYTWATSSIAILSSSTHPFSSSPSPPLLLLLHKWKVVQETKIKRRNTLFIHEIGTFAISSIWFSSWVDVCGCVDTTYACARLQFANLIRYANIYPLLISLLSVCRTHPSNRRFLSVACHFNHKMRNISIESQVFLDFRDIFFLSLSFTHFIFLCVFFVVVDRTWFILFWIHGCGKNLSDNLYRFFWIIITSLGVRTSRCEMKRKQKWENDRWRSIVTPPMNVQGQLIASTKQTNKKVK